MESSPDNFGEGSTPLEKKSRLEPASYEGEGDGDEGEGLSEGSVDGVGVGERVSLDESDASGVGDSVGLADPVGPAVASAVSKSTSLWAAPLA